jgi:hypothetical protein
MVPRLEALPEPANLGRIKDEVIRRWGTLDLLDVRSLAVTTRPPLKRAAPQQGKALIRGCAVAVECRNLLQQW